MGSALEAGVSSSGVLAAGARPGFAVVRVTYQTSEVHQSEVIQLRVAYVSHVSLIPVSVSRCTLPEQQKLVHNRPAPIVGDTITEFFSPISFTY